MSRALAAIALAGFLVPVAATPTEAIPAKPRHHVKAERRRTVTDVACIVTG